MKKTLSLILLSLILPGVSNAQGFSLNQAGLTFKGVVLYVLSIINILIPILFGVAFIVFFWGLSRFILNSSKPDEIKKGKTYMLWGILALFILITFQVIIGIVSDELELGNKTIPGVLLKTNANPNPR